MNNKRITKIGTFIIVVLEFILFATTWFVDYNDSMFRTYKQHGFYSCLLIWLVIYLWLCGLYRAFSFSSNSVGDTVVSQFISFGIADLLLYLVCLLLHRGYITIIPGIVCVVVQLGLACLAVIVIKELLMRSVVPEKTIILYGGTYDSRSAELFVKRLMKKFYHMFNILEVVNYYEHRENIIPKLNDYEKIILLGVAYEDRRQLARYAIDANKTFYFVPDIEEIIFMNCEIKNHIDTPLNRFSLSNERYEYLFVKRFIDVFFSMFLLLILWPIMLLIVLAIKIDDQGPAIFKQLRVTKNEKQFYIYKFRSMVLDADNVSKYGVRPTIDNDPRITRVGRVLRTSRMDELPQLFNILKGDMSFVGPRPERIEHVLKYEEDLPEFKYRHMVRAGLTGYAQVYGKYNTSPEDKLRLDLIYIMNAGLYMDLKLFLLTIRTLLQRESTEGFATSQAIENVGEEL